MDGFPNAMEVRKEIDHCRVGGNGILDGEDNQMLSPIRFEFRILE